MAILLASYYVCAAADTPPPVTVIFSQTTPDGVISTTKVIPWKSGLDIGKAIATAGGYSTPPFRKIFLMRDGDTTPVSKKSIIEGDTPLDLQPGDIIEIK